MTLCTCKHFVPTCHYSETQIVEFVASLHRFALGCCNYEDTCRTVAVAGNNPWG